ncbi:MAG: NAD(P)-dependent oxidoreductase [Acidobacteriia bacterium]|nr:NAD(P)-dependent oxidoreductase [Terriglobia bacterium]MYG04692.1 NAD(P)-dependent oxidoreductase [Terriglobia bacterium]MYK08874.1 NAD(P)-dependent oxidoreductase [Terriglobia bacterium]
MRPSSERKIGVIGLGLLGSAIAERLLAAGFPVCGFDIDAGCRARLEAAGGTVAGSASNVADACRFIVLSLPDSRVVGAVLEEVEANLSDPRLFIDTTTGDPDDTVKCSERLAGRGHEYLDASVGGSSKLLAAGQAILMVGGDADAFQRSSSILGAIGERVFHVGQAGAGIRMKLVFNLVLGLNRAVLAEGLAFASRYGLSGLQALEILEAGPAQSRAMDTKGRKMLARDFAPEARLSQHLKDVRLILEAGAGCGAHLPLSLLHRQLLEHAESLDLGASDNSAIIESFR